MRTQTKRNNTIPEVADFLKGLHKAAVTTHTGADGDAIGSAVALVYLARFVGAQEPLFCHSEPVPDYLRWLLPNEPLSECPPGHDLLVVATSRPDRVGVPHEEGAHPIRLNVDHHEDNPLYGDVSTDTGGFRFRNVSAEAHELVAELLRAGVVPAEVNERINRTGTVEQLNIVGRSMANAKRYGEAIVSVVDEEDYALSGASELDSKESIDRLRNVAGVEVVAHLREVEGGTKASLRSESVDVGEIARGFGGGGHRLAAGYTASKPPREAREDLLLVLKGVVDLGDD